MLERTATLVASILLVGMPMPAAGQAVRAPEASVDTIESDSDPTRPVFVSIRPELYNVSDAVQQRATIVRYDDAALGSFRPPHGAPGLILRFELPYAAADAGRDRVGGLGDFYGQCFFIPYVHGRFAWALGSGFVVPTATDPLIGGGKWVAAPVTAPVWRMPRGLFLVKIQNFTSIGGDPSRPDQNYLLLTPTFIRAVGQGWWVLADSETRTTWTNQGRTGIKSGLQIGRRIAPGVGLWAKPERWWGPNRGGQWNLKLGIVWYQRR